MTTKQKTDENASDREIVLSRVFDAPRTLVWKALTDPKHVPHWWGPNGYTITVKEVNVKPGGTWRFMMHGPDGTNYDTHVVYIEVTKPERLVYTMGDGADDPGKFNVTITLEEQAGKTKITMRMRFNTAEQREATVSFGAIELGYQTLEKLANYLPKVEASA
jgi:uncharacterized protein YndB with AHSA1/START domain